MCGNVDHFNRVLIVAFLQRTVVMLRRKENCHLKAGCFSFRNAIVLFSYHAYSFQNARLSSKQIRPKCPHTVEVSPRCPKGTIFGLILIGTKSASFKVA